MLSKKEFIFSKYEKYLPYGLGQYVKEKIFCLQQPSTRLPKDTSLRYILTIAFQKRKSNPVIKLFLFSLESFSLKVCKVCCHFKTS